ncbi:hypothetical protein CCAND93_20034 [Capnocytophaga canis]|uniref:Uncharacterized protein n=1 Tax=Capnocytophaga canis TaxID=1848903 RepID=A0A0B7IPI7_9FLAO|nr:hypothetical protein CCAND93_20034 [Capnocytophaga canis]
MYVNMYENINQNKKNDIKNSGQKKTSKNKKNQNLNLLK